VTLDTLHGSDVRVKVHLLPQRNNRARVTGDLVARARDSAEHGSSALATEGVDGLTGKSGTGLLEVLETGVEVDEGRLGDARDVLEDTLGGLEGDREVS
jgi:hypothetical protein